jgi:hypothetical protein
MIDYNFEEEIIDLRNYSLEITFNYKSIFVLRFFLIFSWGTILVYNLSFYNGKINSDIWKLDCSLIFWLS